MLQLARQGLEQAVHSGRVELPSVDQLPEFLQVNGACFVTLNSLGHLRGCIGTLEAVRPLGHDLLLNAQHAALRDPRFRSVTAEEPIAVSVSVLTPSEPFPVSSEKMLLDSLRPNIDGLILEFGAHRATFLPVVWESLTQPAEFLQALKQKAGLPANFWSDQIRFRRYGTIYFSETSERVMR